MIKIASCGAVQFKDGGISDAVAACAQGQGGIEYELDEFQTPVELIESASAALHDMPYDLVVCAVDLKGVSGVHTVSELGELYSFTDDLRVVLCDADPQHAFSAQQSGVDGFLLEPISQEDFDRVVGKQMQDIVVRHQQSFVVRCRDRVRRISFDRLSFVETSGHDQVLHHIGQDALCDMRGSSRELFGMLESDGRFFKVGSSHIVNLDYVETFDSKEGYVILHDGVRIPVPVRSRKPLEQALIERGHVVA